MKKRYYVLSFILLFVSLFTPVSEAHFSWEKIPIYNCLFGFFGALLLIFGAKLLGKNLIQRDEDYYG